MNLNKRPLLLTTLAGLLALGLVMNVSAGVQAQAQRSPVRRSIPQRWEFKPPKFGMPREGRTQAATRGSEGSCIQGNKSVTALVPASGDGLTASKYPTFFWYMPPTSALEVEFMLKDKQKDIYSTRFAIAGTPGIMSIKLPGSAGLPPLEIGKKYTWQLAVICNSDRSADVTVEGEVERVAPDANFVSKWRQATTSQERLALYADARFWYDTLNYLAYLRYYYPNDSAAAGDWKNLLQSVQLDSLAEEKF